MVKKIIAVATAILMLCCTVPLAAFADDILDTCPKCGERTYETWQDFSTSVPDLGFPISIKRRHCTSCQYTYYDWNCMGYTGYKEFDSGSGNLIVDYLKEWKDKTFGKNATAKKYETGGGSAGTGGVGRHPSGYQDSTGTPSINLDGVYIFSLSHDYTYARINAASKTSSSTEDSKYSFPVYRYCADSTLKSTFDQGTITESGDSVKYSVKFDEYKYSGYFGERFKGVAPCDGQYSLYIRPKYSISGSVFDSSYNDSVFRSSSGDLGLYGLDSYYVAGSTISIYSNVSLNYIGGYYPKSVTYQFTGVPYLKCKPTAPLYSKKTNITINNNTWNGNIYQDNSTNLTYIYPQYTTINENNETVTNISNNPIIYNNETKQYYTYDSVTNNYYYITYEAPTPSPSPDPTPTPDPGTDPTPTPEPGGDTGDTTGILAVLVEIRDNMIQGFADLKATLVQGWADLSANFTLAIENLNLNITNIFNKKFPDQSTPETAQPSPSPSPSPSPTPDPGETPTPTPAPTDKPSNGNTNNFWNFVFPGGNDDGTENGHKGILWALISLLIAVVTFVLGLGSAYSYVFPFLPAGLVTTIHICVLVLLLFAIIKFVRSFL